MNYDGVILKMILKIGGKRHVVILILLSITLLMLLK